jgi:hypothetical protein
MDAVLYKTARQARFHWEKLPVICGSFSQGSILEA